MDDDQRASTGTQLVIDYGVIGALTVYLIPHDGPGRIIGLGTRLTVPDAVRKVEEVVEHADADAVQVDATGTGMMLYEALSRRLSIPVHRLRLGSRAGDGA